ncbi:MAG TPA: FAD-dependent oxidoreductase [Rhizobiaceae bacterium]|nr:FAD-dependent oxidoreductase [Rhizobiaceae bacterium]
MSNQAEYEADVIVLGFGAAGACAAIEAHDAGASVILIERQPEATHYSNSRMSGGGYHSPHPDGDRAALKEYAKAMFSGENLSVKLDGETPDFGDAYAGVWAELAPENDAFMRSLDPDYKPMVVGAAAFPDFPGAADSRYAVVRASYVGGKGMIWEKDGTIHLDKQYKENGEALHFCLLNGLHTRNIPIHYETRGRSLVTDEDGAVTGLKAERGEERITYRARRGVVLTCGGYEYNRRMRRAFLDGPGAEGWAFYGTPENTGDGIEMAMKAGAALSAIGKVAGRVIAAVPERRNGLKIGLNTSGVGKPNEIVVDNSGKRYASERRITKDPSRYFFYKEGLQFDTINLVYPRVPSWMIFDETLRESSPVVHLPGAAYNGIDWGKDNLAAIEKGWIIKGETLEELAEKINAHPDNREMMDAETLKASVARFNEHCVAGTDPDFNREPDTLRPVEKAPFYAIPLYLGGPNTKGGLRSNAGREVLDWNDEPIAGLYSAGEIASVFQFVYQGGGNLAECITFGRVAGRNAAARAVSAAPVAAGTSQAA